MFRAVQFAVDHQGQQVDRIGSCTFRLACLRGVKDLITAERNMMVSGYNAFRGEVNVLQSSIRPG